MHPGFVRGSDGERERERERERVELEGGNRRNERLENRNFQRVQE